MPVEVVYECQLCFGRGPSPEEIEHAYDWLDCSGARVARLEVGVQDGTGRGPLFEPPQPRHDD